MSIEHQPHGLRHDDAAPVDSESGERSSAMTAPDTDQIARMLTEKYGWDALPFAHDRAARALEVGDHLALESWRSVIAATQALLRQLAEI